MNCPACKSKLIWQNDYDLEDIGSDDKGVVSYYNCSNNECDSTFEWIQKEKKGDEEIE